MSERIIRESERVPGGYLVHVEVTGAFTDGASRWERVFVPEPSGDTDDVMSAVAAALAPSPIDELRGMDIHAYGELKAVTEKPIEALRQAFGGKR